MGGLCWNHCFFTTFHGRTPIREIARQIRAVGCDRVLLTTDFGQLNSLYSDEGMEECPPAFGGRLLREELETMMCRTPRHLLHPEEAGLRPLQLCQPAL